MLWGLREVDDRRRLRQAHVEPVDDRPRPLPQSTRWSTLVTGLTAGAHTYKWAHKVVSGTTGAIAYGTAASPVVTDYGPAIMAIIPYVA